MAAITKRLLHLRPYARPNLYPQRHFSSSSDDNDDAPKFEQPPQTPPSVTLGFDAVRASLQNSSPPPTDRSSPTRGQSSGGSVNDIRSRLAEFRSRSAPPPPSPLVSLPEMYARNLRPKGERSDAIRASLSKLGPAGAMDSERLPSDSTRLSILTQNLKNKDNPSVFGRNRDNIKGIGRKSELENMQNPVYLGEKLKTMRPEKRKGKWFSLHELSDRLAKVKEAGEKELSNWSGISFRPISEGILKMGQDSDLKARDRSKRVMTVGILGSMGASMAENTGPPKDHLVEKYFHPDNMSSAEKMKLELAKVRDEFKMSESDCGSARVQVAQLTTKIKHLSTALHKKDKHSRKGLQAMVQQRKKLLKYLRRTDWDSYCLVLSKLGLRDNTETKA